MGDEAEYHADHLAAINRSKMLNKYQQFLEETKAKMRGKNTEDPSKNMYRLDGKVQQMVNEWDRWRRNDALTSEQIQEKLNQIQIDLETEIQRFRKEWECRLEQERLRQEEIERQRQAELRQKEQEERERQKQKRIADIIKVCEVCKDLFDVSTWVSKGDITFVIQNLPTMWVFGPLNSCVGSSMRSFRSSIVLICTFVRSVPSCFSFLFSLLLSRGITLPATAFGPTSAYSSSLYGTPYSDYSFNANLERTERNDPNFPLFPSQKNRAIPKPRISQATDFWDPRSGDSFQDIRSPFDFSFNLEAQSLIPYKPDLVKPTEYDSFYASSPMNHHLIYGQDRRFAAHQPGNRISPEGNPSVDEFNAINASLKLENSIKALSLLWFMIPTASPPSSAPVLSAERGVSTIRLSQITSYTGEVRLGVPDGVGRLVDSTTGRVLYSGEWREGRFQGRGTLYSGEHELQSGCFENGQLTSGRIVNPDGSMRIGAFRDGELEGEGRVVFASQAAVSGEWREGKPVGKMHYALPGGFEFDFDQEEADRDTKKRVVFSMNCIYFRTNEVNGNIPDFLFYSNGDIFVGETQIKMLPYKGLFFHKVNKGYYRMEMNGGFPGMEINDITVIVGENNRLKKVLFC